ncbi:MAG: hypothetical protein M3R17_05190 [Bacteroidota bacterium]|nr:hypothetical protein [Bacteroidota bacterium]
MKQFRSFIFLAVLCSTFFGCTPDPTFPVEPVLTYKENRQPVNSDSLITVFSFTDGDGDIGLAPTEQDSNMVLTVYVPDANGVFRVMDNVSTPQPDSICYTYRIPHLTAGQVGLEGDIYVTIEHKSFIGRDTLQFNAFLLDQSQHRSNYVRTKTIILTN